MLFFATMDEDAGDNAIIAQLMELAMQYSLADAATLKCGPPGNVEWRLVSGSEWEVVRPLMIDWLDAKVLVIERMIAQRRCADAVGELCFSPDYGTEAQDRLIEAAEAEQSRAIRALYHAKRDERYIAQQLEALGFNVAN